MKRDVHWVVGVCALLGAPSLQAAIIVVDCTGSGDVQTIQGGIDLAVDGDELVIMPNDCNAEGRYFENIDLLGKAITLRSRNPRNPQSVAATIIDGSFADKSSVTMSSSEGPDTRLLGLTITGGTGTLLTADFKGFDDPVRFGGGVLCVGSSPVISNCNIQNNVSTWGAGVGVSGGSPKFTKCIISNNRASSTWISDQPGVYWIGDGGAMNLVNSSATIDDCLVLGNIVDSDGLPPQSTVGTAGIEITVYDTTPADPVVLRRCLLSNNVQLGSQTGGSGVISGGGALSLTGFNKQYTKSIAVKARIEDTQFLSNSSVHGAGVEFSGTAANDLVFERCVFAENSASQHGGAIFATRGLFELRNSWVVNNAAAGSNPYPKHGGAIFMGLKAEAIIQGCSVVGNVASAAASADRGGGIYMSAASSVALSNSIVWANVSDQDDQIAGVVSGILTLDYCDIQDGANSIAGSVVANNVIDVDPLFVDQVNGDLHLGGDSPCIDAGDPTYVPFVNETDIDGDPRLVGVAIDLGADELVGQ